MSQTVMSFFYGLSLIRGRRHFGVRGSGSAVLLAFCLLFAGLGNVQANENLWAFAQGNGGHTGYIPEAAGVGSPAGMAWRVALSNLVQQIPLIVEDRVIVRDNSWVFSAIDIATGDIVWQRDDIGLVSLSQAATPYVTDGERLYLIGQRQIDDGGILRWVDHIIALDVATGAISWEKHMDDLTEDHDWVDVQQLFGVTVADGKVMLSVRALGEAFQPTTLRMRLAALNPTSGAVMWQIPSDPQQEMKMPAWICVDGEMLYYFAGSRLYSLNTANQDIALIVDLDDTGYSYHNSDLVLANGIFYVIAGDGATWDTDSEFRLLAYDMENSVFLFNEEINGGNSSDPQYLAVTDESVFFANESGDLYAYNAVTGAETWHVGLNDTTIQRGGPIVVSNEVYIATSSSDTSTIHALAADTGNELWTLPFGERTFSPFAFMNGTLVVGGDALYGIAEIVLSDYNDWIDYYGLEGADSLLDANPTGDGFDNMQKFVFGLDPTESAGSVFTVLYDGGLLFLRWNAFQDDGAGYAVEHTVPLLEASWMSASNSNISLIAAPDDAIPPGYQRFEYSVDIDGLDRERKFFRIRADMDENLLAP